jgi:glutathione peroxidase
MITSKQLGGSMLSLLLCLTGCGKQVDMERAKMNEGAKRSIYDFTVKDIDGRDVDLGSYKGSVLLIVNVASKCGFTPQYEGLQKLYETHKDKGLVILGFPANDFLWQEPGTDKEIKSFCTLKYNVTFPMFAKISVKGSDQHPLYAFLTDKQANPSVDGKISWNFNKFLVARDGRVIRQFGSRTKPLADELVKAVEAALAEGT